MNNHRLSLVLINSISIGRGIAGFVFVAVALQPSLNLVAISVYVFAASSDAVDGLIARRLGCTTAGGRALDLFGDKYLTVASALYAAFRGIPLAACLLIVGREIFLLAMRTVSVNNTPVVPLTKLIGVITVLTSRSLTVALLFHPNCIPSQELVFLFEACGLAYGLSVSYSIWRNRRSIRAAFRLP